MNYNRPLTSYEREALAQVSPRKEHTPKLFDPTTGSQVNGKQKELPRTGIHDNMPRAG